MICVWVMMIRWVAGAAVQWLKESLGIVQSASEIEELAGKIENTGRVYFVPASNGLFAPWWRDDARGICIGITRFTNKSPITSVLESMCFQADLLGCPVVRPASIETTALGAAYASWLAVGVWTEQDVFSDEAKQEKPTTVQPNLDGAKEEKSNVLV
ncbi:hypothetical protein C5167_034078 [Papaver somniferum]|uniref:Carbohydrate kinase FGGY C-terminal domain-containing protein n=1 Tax=Papaver somniferum TaxID=3469 RepID=A0A4Y7KAD5_PAPSO|nr:hypothetical protein C5167_034078 [Papaver somniferum]